MCVYVRQNLTAVLVGLLSTGCYSYPCDTDVLACEEGDALEIDRTCEPSAPLEIVLLEMDGLEPVVEGTWPRVHHGPQGGIHFDLGLRVAGLDPEHAEAELDLDARECVDEDCGDATVFAQRKLNASEDLFEADEDGHLLPNIVVLLEREPSGSGRLVVDVRDGCGRRVEVVHRASP